MDLVGVGSALLRRWVVVGVGLVLAVVAGAGVYANAGLSWSSGAVVVVVPPSGVTGTLPNPYLQLDYTVATTASILVQSVTSAPVEADIAGSTSGSYTASNIELNPQTYTPSITITSTSSSAADAVATAQAVVFRLGDKLTELQTNSAVATGNRLYISTAVAPTAAVSAASGRIRSAGAAFAAVALLTVVVALALDGYLRSRRRRTAPAATPDDDRVPTGAPVPSRDRAATKKVVAAKKTAPARKPRQSAGAGPAQAGRS